MKRVRATLYQSHQRDSRAKKKSSDITTRSHLFSLHVVSAARTFQPDASFGRRARWRVANLAMLVTLYEEGRFSSDARASRARVLVTLIYEMIRRDVHSGIASLCLGGGNAVAMAVERQDGLEPGFECNRDFATVSKSLWTHSKKHDSTEGL